MEPPPPADPTGIPAIPRHNYAHLQGFWCVLAVAVVVRIGACWFWSDDLTRDRDAYLGIARNISSGKGLCSPDTSTPTAYRPPVYPIAIGIFRFLLPEPLAVASVNLIAGIATAAAVWFLVGLWWQPTLWMKVTAGIAIAVDPLLLRYSAQPMTECLFTALTTWALIGMTRLWTLSHNGLRTAWWTGALAGLGALCRPTLLPFLGLAGLGMLFGPLHGNSATLQTRGKQIAGFVLSLSLVLSLWVGRNLLVIGKPILTTTHGGYTLLLGNNPVFFREVARQPWGTVWQHESLVRWQESLAVEMRQELGDQVSEVAADEWYARQATHAIHDDPDGFHAAVGYRLRSFWSLTPRGPEATSGRIRPFVAFWYAGVFLLAAIGFVRALGQRYPSAFLGGLLIATVMALHLVYWTDTRMRAPLHPVLVTFAAGALWWPNRVRR